MKMDLHENCHAVREWSLGRSDYILGKIRIIESLNIQLQEGVDIFTWNFRLNGSIF